MAQVRRAQSIKTVAICVAGAVLAVALALIVPHIGASGMVINQGIAPVEATSDGAAKSGANVAENSVSTVTKLIVHIDGAVMLPGVYELTDGSRVNDAIELAGGLTSEADTTTLNLAAKLTDGQKVTVPRIGESVVSSGDGGVASGQSLDSSVSEAGGLVNINTATAEELDTLPGVGPSTAATIIQDREQSGPFTSIEDLMRISGIGEKKFAKLKDYICV